MMNTLIPLNNQTVLGCGGLLWVDDLDVRGSE